MMDRRDTSLELILLLHQSSSSAEIRYVPLKKGMWRDLADSESIASIGYAPHRCELEIEFRQSGDVYRYFEVPAAEYAEFMAAESKGAYLNQVFKSKGHPYVAVKRGRSTGPES